MENGTYNTSQSEYVEREEKTSLWKKKVSIISKIWFEYVQVVTSSELDDSLTPVTVAFQVKRKRKK